MATAIAANRALDSINGTVIDGRTLRVEHGGGGKAKGAATTDKNKFFDASQQPLQQQQQQVQQHQQQQQPYRQDSRFDKDQKEKVCNAYTFQIHLTHCPE
jgi:hypothetical protein